MNKKQTTFTIAFGLLASVLLNILFFSIFYLAYFNDGTSVVTVNTYGEGMLEAFLLVPLTFMFLCLCLYLSITNLRDEITTKTMLIQSKKTRRNTNYKKTSPVP